MEKINLVIVFLLLVSINLKAKSLDMKANDCMDQALIVGQQAYAAGYGDAESTWYMNVYYALCEGYSMADIKM